MIAIRGGIRVLPGTPLPGVAGRGKEGAIAHATSTIALITPVSGLVYDGKIVDQLVERRPMRDPRPRVDPAVLDQSDDPLEVVRQRVAEAKRVISRRCSSGSGKLHRVGHDADEDDPPRVGDVVERSHIDFVLPVASKTTG